MKLPLDIDLSGKVAVITGAGGVLCGMFAEAVARCGAKVALLDIDQEKAGEIARNIESEGFAAKAFLCNVLDSSSLAAAHETVKKNLGSCDILINGAGGNNPKATTDHEFFDPSDIGKLKTFFDLDKEGVEFVFNINYLGTLLATQTFAPDMIGKKGACIVNISSMNAFVPLTKIPAYSGAKAAVSNFTQWLAVYFSRVGIRCNAIAPGFFVSNQNRALLFNEDGSPTERAGNILSKTPMGRFGEPKELIGALLFLLCEDASSFVNGAVIPVDGAFSAYSGV